ncbi:hypothetical protein JVT61DRAFT_11444 [Boletus reticuloceps]|uniref:Uncharacterized protein n=1 Tax=Boletus reticuloceps TaxID=495285 RepID=A0A8I3ABC8_9AGAM|nr:hypothetical protein JVT61DRAFT_11444 [Boletus reticuloceps]
MSKKHHISDLAKSLAGCDVVDVTLAQWGQFAFLQNYLLFCNMVDESLVKKAIQAGPDSQEDADRDSADNQFWEFIDQLLDEMHEEAHIKSTIELWKQAWEKYFTDMLQLDLEQFPAENRSASLHPLDRKSTSKWQKAINQDHTWL